MFFGPALPSSFPGSTTIALKECLMATVKVLHGLRRLEIPALHWYGYNIAAAMSKVKAFEISKEAAIPPPPEGGGLLAERG